MNGKVTFSPATQQQHTLRCHPDFAVQQLPQFQSSAHATLPVLSTYLCHLCRYWKKCCSRYFGTDIGFCSLVVLLRSESFPLPGLVWSSAETERDYMNVQPLQHFLCHPAGCTQLLHFCATGQTAQNTDITSFVCAQAGTRENTAVSTESTTYCDGADYVLLMRCILGISSLQQQHKDKSKL